MTPAHDFLGKTLLMSTRRQGVLTKPIVPGPGEPFALTVFWSDAVNGYLDGGYSTQSSRSTKYQCVGDVDQDVLKIEPWPSALRAGAAPLAG
jgi:hypothetical protein